MKSKKFDYSLNFKKIDFRRYPELYVIGRGEQGVLSVEPYKSEILKHWRFKTPTEAKKSAKIIFRMFKSYGREGNFVGMDMARKFLQMGFTRSRRYANHRSGKKYDGPVPSNLRGVSGAHGRKQLPRTPDPIKAESAQIFRDYLEKAKTFPRYLTLRKKFLLGQKIEE